MTTYKLTIRPGHPDFLDLPWDISLADWNSPRLVERAKGISRHLVRFVAYDERLYVIKELPTRAARRDYEVLTALQGSDTLAATPVGLVQARHPDPDAEQSAALITEYLEYSFSYRELLQGAGFGDRRNQMLDAFAGLLVELHIAGCMWGDCSLSNVLYRYDAQAVDTIMVDAETAYLYPSLSDGQRNHDLSIMIENVAGGMADIAASHGVSLDDADLWLGEDIAERYRNLWCELTRVERIGPDERYKITDRIRRLNELGFDVREVNLVPARSGDHLKLKVQVGGRNYHARRLHELTGVDALEWQAWQLLSDLHYYNAHSGADTTIATALAWRARVLEPMLATIREIDGVFDPMQGFCDVLHHRYVRSVEAGYDIGTRAALTDWIASDRPGYRLP